MDSLMLAGLVPSAIVFGLVAWLTGWQLRFAASLPEQIERGEVDLLSSPWVRVERVMQAPPGSTYLMPQLLWQMHYVQAQAPQGMALAWPSEHVPHAQSPHWPPRGP